ncbi:RepA [Crocosphaera watsonii WH 0402]|uniref:RepA n=1 Tax=Crocosphaera watsonii WH 0402 TaxID=1284629 RepID=T2JKR1_CROWT|nr:RepA [Crocosphaera watsonii WH 0402]
MDKTVATTEDRLQRFIQLVDERLNEEQKNKDRKKTKTLFKCIQKALIEL